MKKFMAAAIIAGCSFGAVASTASVGPSAGPLSVCTAELLRSIASSRTIASLPDKSFALSSIVTNCVYGGQ